MTKRLLPTPDEARGLIDYYRRVLATTTSADRRLRAEHAIARLKRVLADEPARATKED